MDKKPVNIFWFRRDLRLHDNAGLYHALKGENPVLCLFIFDREILDKLEDKDDARVTFIYQTIEGLNAELKKHKSSLLVKYGKAEHAWDEINAVRGSAHQSCTDGSRARSSAKGNFGG